MPMSSNVSGARDSLHSGSRESCPGLRRRYQSDAGASVRPPGHVGACILAVATAVFLEIGPQESVRVTLEVLAVM